MSDEAAGFQAEVDSLGKTHRQVCDRLTVLSNDPSIAARDRAELEAWRGYLDEERSRLDAPVRVAFVAAVGCGKSTLISAATGLRLAAGDDPQDWAVLPVGDGRTTLGEVRILPEDRQDIDLEVEPLDVETLRIELRTLVEDAWAEARGQQRAFGQPNSGEELHALFRVWLNLEDEGAEPPLLSWAKGFPTAIDFFEAANRRIDFEHRCWGFTRTFEAGEAGLLALKGVLAALMRGVLPGAPAPRRTKIRIPTRMCSVNVTEIIDTQGLEHESSARLFQARPDLGELFGDPDVAIVGCSPFQAAPDHVSRELVKVLAGASRDTGVREPRAVRLLLVDNRSTTAGDSAERRRKDKLVEVMRILRRDPMLADLPGSFAVAVDARREPERLVALINQLAGEVGHLRLRGWKAALDGAQEALAEYGDIERRARASADAIRMHWAWNTAWVSSDSPTTGPLQCLARVIRARNSFQVQHWSHVHAAFRRRGRYRNLDLVELAAGEAATEAWARATKANYLMQDAYSRMGPGDREPNRAATPMDTARLARLSRELVLLRAKVHAQWREKLNAYFLSAATDELWARGYARWGQGSGYLDDIADLFDDLARRAPPELTENPQVVPSLSWLPPSPPQLFVHKVHLENFRCIANGSLEFGPATVLVADNGGGKTAWLEAVAAALGALLPGFGAGGLPPLGVRDARQGIRMLNGIPDRQAHYPVRITLTGELEGSEQTWSREIGPGGSEVRSGPTGIHLLAASIGEEVRQWVSRPLPLIAYYSTQRLWPQDLLPGEREPGNRQEGYLGCLSAAPTHAHLLAWVRDFTLAGLQQRREVPQLQAIEAAVVCCIPGAVAFFFDVASKRLMLEMEDGRTVPFDLLSDGYRNLTALAADIAWRSTVLNPELGPRAPELTEGVVLIDEVDLHLHPKWQRRVVGDLRRAFPKIQFILTTHSPQVIASVEPGAVRVLRAEGSADSVAHTRGLDSNTLLDEVFGDHGYPADTTARVGEIRAALERGALEEANMALDALEADLGSMAELVRTLRWEALDASVGEE
jgi:predicted ATP-binding protein involved in virulence